MKPKSIVFTVALAAATSVFAVDAKLDVAWFTTNSTQTAEHFGNPNGTFDTLLTSPIVITNDTATAASTGLTVDSYKITAYITNLVVHASLPDAPGVLDTLTAKGAICAVSDNKWYGLNNSNWTALDKVAAEEAYNPVDGDPYIFVTTVSATAQTVGYEVRKPDNTLVASNLAFTTSADVGEPSRFAFAGTGAYTNLVAEFIVSILNSTAVEVDGGMIAVSDSLAESFKTAVITTPNEPAGNGLKNWVNYVLGIDSPTSAAKPYIVPVQNVTTNKMDLKLVGVAGRARSVTGAKVSYTIEELASPTATEGTPASSSEDPNASFEITLDPKATKYYRIKINIDPAH